MAEKETTHYKLPYPTSAGEVKLGAADFEELAKVTDETLYEKYAGAWESLVLGAKAEENPSVQTLRVRKEMGITVARLRGGVVAKAGQEIKPGETIATLPAGWRPPNLVAVAVVLSGGQAGYIEITAAGVIKPGVVSVTATAAVLLDSVTFNLT